MNENLNSIQNFWLKQESSVQGMMLNAQANKIEDADREEIISQVSSLNLHGLMCLELGAGIGRFTGWLAKQVKHVTAVDFVEKFLEANQKTNDDSHNINYHHANVMDLYFENDQFDLIFSNWLFMYLTDSDLLLLKSRFDQWLVPGGCLFFRESCLTNSQGQRPDPDGQVFYRAPDLYLNLFSNSFEILRIGNLKIYEQVHDNPNQRYWLLRKKN